MKERFPSSPENNEGDIRGEGFVLKGPSRKGASPLRDAVKVEFRPGESTDAVKKRKAQESEETSREGKIESPNNTEFAAEHFAVMLKNQLEYSETLIVNPDGHIEKNRRIADSAPPYFAGLVETPADLYKLMKEVKDAHPEYKISFESDPNGTWIRYKVSK